MDGYAFWRISCLGFLVACFMTKGVICDPCRQITARALWCHGKELDQNFINNSLKGKLKVTPDVQEIHLTNGTFSELPPNAFSDCAQQSGTKLTNLTKLDLSFNNITKIHGKTFHCMPNLEKLFLHHNRWQIHKDNHTGFFNNLPNLVELDLTSTFESPDRLHVTKLRYVLDNSNFSKLETLKLGNNDMQFLDDGLGKSLCNMDRLRHINLQGNNLVSINITHCFQRSKLLEKIDLSDNSFTTLDTRSMTVFNAIQNSNPQVNFTVNLRNQQWSCDCGIKQFRDWLSTTKVHVMSKSDYRCYDGANFRKHIVNLSDRDICHDNETDSSVQAGVVVVIVLLVIIGLALIGVLFVYRTRLTSFAHGVRKSLNRAGHVQYSSVDDSPLTADA